MKEVVITGPRQYEVREVPIPKPGDGEVLIQMKAAGVCGSDIHLFLGENPNAVYPRIPGHENAGVVVETGKNVTAVKPGDAVVVDLVVACGRCPQCLRGRRNICRTVKARGAATDGGWREYFTVPAHEVYLLPRQIPFRDAALIEPFAIGGHCTSRAGIQGGESVLVLGSGTIGAVILQTLKQKGCRVICADINESCLARAKDYGADAVVNTRTQNLRECVQAFTDGGGVDAIFDSAGYPGSLTALLEQGIPANGATLIIAWEIPSVSVQKPKGTTVAPFAGRNFPSDDQCAGAHHRRDQDVVRPIPAHDPKLSGGEISAGGYGQPLHFV